LGGPSSAQRFRGRLGTASNAELAEDGSHVMVDRPRGEEEALTDLGVAQPLRYEIEDLDLAWREQVRVASGGGPWTPWQPAGATLT
jgi:hypothetical protein